MYILEDYATNSAKLNSYIISLFNKLAFQVTFAPLFFQLSYFLLFNEILNDRGIVKDKNFNPVRKFCQKIVREFFVKSKNNPVLFCEILFYKTNAAVDDINEPGAVHQQQREKAERESRRQARRNRIEGMDNLDAMDDDFDDEEEYQQLDVDMTPWTDEEDKILRDNYATYSTQANAANILQTFLENECQSTRSVVQINHRLRQLGLLRARAARNRNNNKSDQPKRRVKPKDMSIHERKNIIYHCIHKACHINQLQADDQDTEEKKEDDKMKDNLNKLAFKWLSDKLQALYDLIGEVISAESNTLLDDIAIVPIASNEFDFVENIYVKDILTKLGFLAPNKYIGTCWWRIPRELLSIYFCFEMS